MVVVVVVVVIVVGHKNLTLKLDENQVNNTGEQNRKSWLVHGIFQLILLV